MQLMKNTKIPAESIPGRILVVDDEITLLKTFRYCLEDEGHHVTTAQSAMQAEQLVHQQVFDVCFLDLRLGNVSAIDLLPVLKSAAPWLRVVVVTAHSSVDTAVQAIRAGAVDYLVKPCSPEQLRVAAAKQLQARQMELRVEELERTSDQRGDEARMDTQSPTMMALYDMARRAAETDANVLILGESGTGKNVLARAIHRWSQRAAGPFVTVNGPGLSGELFESELFGHRKGAFTGAVQTSPGRVSQADGGSLFLDEVGDVPLPLQPKLLRFLQDKEYESVGDPVTRRANVRLIAATNRDLPSMAREGSFRQDLLYRLDVIRMEIPALRQRREDILSLAEGLLSTLRRTYPRAARGFDEPAKEALYSYEWPGNVRELRNVIERACILCTEELITPRYLALGDTARPTAVSRPGATISLEQLEREHILAVVTDAETLDAAASLLGIDVSTLYRKRKQYGI